MWIGGQMELGEVPGAVKAVFVIVAAVVAWVAIRFALRVALRFVAVGCLAIAALVVIGGLAGWLG